MNVLHQHLSDTSQDFLAAKLCSWQDDLHLSLTQKGGLGREMT
jgi:hypothetical protein